MNTSSKKILTVMNADELRDILPESGLFEMLDCEVDLNCPPNAETAEIEKMVMIIESMINVTDIRVSGVPRSEHELSYTVVINSVPVQTAKGRSRG